VYSHEAEHARWRRRERLIARRAERHPAIIVGVFIYTIVVEVGFSLQVAINAGGGWRRLCRSSCCRIFARATRGGAITAIPKTVDEAGLGWGYRARRCAGIRTPRGSPSIP